MLRSPLLSGDWCAAVDVMPLAATLLHRFGPDCWRLGFDQRPSAQQAATLAELGRLIWDPEQAGTGGG